MSGDFHEDHNRGYFHPHGIPSSIGERIGQEARRKDDERQKQLLKNKSDWSVPILILIVIVGFVLASDPGLVSIIISIAAILAVAVVASVLTPFVAVKFERNVVHAAPPQRLLPIFILNAVAALFYGLVFAWFREAAPVVDSPPAGLYPGATAFALALVLVSSLTLKKRLGFSRAFVFGLATQLVLIVAVFATLFLLQEQLGIRFFA